MISKSGLTATLWAINLASISASVLVYIYLAHYAYSALGSLLVSEFVLFAPMVMPVLLAFQLNRVAGRLQASTLFLLANVTGALVCAVLLLALPLTRASILAGSAIVGTLDAVQRVARIVAIKRYFSSEEVRFTVPLTLTAQFIAGAIAGAVLAFFPGQLTHLTTALSAILLMGVAAACTLLLPRISHEPQPSFSRHSGLADSLALVRRLPALRDSLASFVILGTFFQGFYSISRVVLPAHHLGLGRTHVGLLQVVASLSAVSGALLFYALSRRKFVFHLPWIYAACSGGMLLACAVPDVRVSFGCYFVFFFFFELAFFRLQGDIMAATPAPDMPLVASFQYALVYAGMMLAIAAGSLLVDRWGLTVTSLIFAVGFYCSLAALKTISAGSSTSSPASI